MIRKAPEPSKVATLVRVSVYIDTKADVLAATGTPLYWYTKTDGVSVFVPPTDKNGQVTYYATQTDANNWENLNNPVTATVRLRPTAMLPNDTTVFRYDSLAVRIALTGDLTGT